MPEDLQSLLDAIPGPGQTEQVGTALVIDKKAQEEANKWQGEIKNTLHQVITHALLIGFYILAALAVVRTLHLILPTQDHAITLGFFFNRRLCCWLSDAQLTTLDHLLLSGGIISLLGSRVGKTLSDNFPY